jgi:hypothetical protein
MMSTVISTQSDLDRAIKDSVTASAPIEGIKIEVSSSYLNKIKTSKTEMTTLIECVIEDAPHQVQKPELTGKAKALLDKDPQKFIERHGQSVLPLIRFASVSFIR